MTLPARGYEPMVPIAPAEGEAMLRSGDARQILRALLWLSMHGPDFAVAERWPLDHASHPDPWVRRNAATALGHVARVHGSIDLDEVMSTLIALLDDPDTLGRRRTRRRRALHADGPPALHREGRQFLSHP